MPLQSQRSDTIKRLTSLFRTIPSAAMAEHHSFQALPIGNSDRRAQQEDEPDSVDEKNEGHDDDDDDEEEQVEEEKDEEEQRRKRASEEPSSELQNFRPPDEAEPGECNSQTLVMRSSIESVAVDQSADLQASSTTRMDGKAESKEPSRLLEKEIIAREAVQAAQNEAENQLQVSVCSIPFSELSKSSSAVPSSTLPKQRLSPQKVNNVHVLEANGKNSSAGKTLSAVSVARRSASDGYSWRKYGQKQVKSPTGSRSYYRCTRSDCGAKKIECCDHLGHVIEIIYKSQHSHEPPWKTNSTGDIKVMPSNEPTVETSVPEQPIRVLNDADPSPSTKEPLQDVPSGADKKRQNSSGLSENGKVILKEEHVDEPELKRRVKKGDLTYLDSHVKPGKKSKFVVHAAGDVGISGDGYRWRKYGQKMVKGNPHPRNYYRCTSAGCPVRKQIETAVDNSNAVIITYKGVHDHDMPVPKKQHSPPSPFLMAAAAPASSNNLHLEKTDSPQNQKSSTQRSADSEGELNGEALALGGEKALESARALLSIGFEMKPY